MKDEHGKTPDDYVIMELQNMGLFVRDYSPGATRDLCKAAELLHRQLCQLDSAHIKEWHDLPLTEFVNAWAKRHDLYLITPNE